MRGSVLARIGRNEVLLAVLSSVTAAFVLVHTVVEPRTDDCARPRELFNRGAPVVGSASALYRFETPEVSQSRLRPPGGRYEFDYTVVRSFDPRTLYYRPENRIFRKTDPERRTLEWVEGEGERVPVHRPLYGGSIYRAEGQIVAGYLLLYEGQVIANPYLAQVVRAPAQLLRGRRPMSLLFAHVVVGEDEADAAEAELHALLLDSLRHFRATCDP